MKLSEIANDVNAENNGVWFEYAAGFKVLIARNTSEKYEAFLRQTLKDQQEDIMEGNIDVDAVEEATKEATAKFLILGWENLQDEKGNEIKFSHDKAWEFFKDPTYQDFYRWVIKMSKRKSRFKKNTLREESKN